MSDVKVPPLSEALIKALDDQFPEKSADLKWSDREVWFKAGQRQVVRWLIEQYTRQQETVLGAS